MGYRSEVVMAVTPEAQPLLLAVFAKYPEVRKLCTTEADESIAHWNGEEDSWFFRWESIKWYKSFEEIMVLGYFMDALESEDWSYFGFEEPLEGCDYESYRFVRIGEDHNDIQVEGGAYDFIAPTTTISY
jgi:hypothetical protein